MITFEQKAKATDLGYYVEDMGKEYGNEFAGQFRWMNKFDHDDFQDYDVSYSENDAWKELFSTHSI